MKTIIAGSRTINDRSLLDEVMNHLPWDVSLTSEVVSGGAGGVDRLGEQWAFANCIPVKQFIPDWTVGKHAGFLRNAEMAQYGEALVVLWDGISKGTQHMMDEAIRNNLKVFGFNKKTDTIIQYNV